MESGKEGKWREHGQNLQRCCCFLSENDLNHQFSDIRTGIKLLTQNFIRPNCETPSLNASNSAF